MGSFVNMSAVLLTHVAIMAFVRFTAMYSNALVPLALLGSCAKCHAPQVCILIASIVFIHFCMFRECCPSACSKSSNSPPGDLFIFLIFALGLIRGGLKNFLHI